ncbi:MAG: hypothetical protein KKE86_16655 [Planctomycetes bacterium]|nr:hypothetical protein [Planctomycetota bacterium]
MLGQAPSKPMFARLRPCKGRLAGRIARRDHLLQDKSRLGDIDGIIPPIDVLWIFDEKLQYPLDNRRQNGKMLVCCGDDNTLLAH